MTTATQLVPASAAELAEIVRSTPRLLAVGARTKPRLSKVPEEVALVSTQGLSGILEYEPEEYTFTAQAGTPLREIIQTLASKGQYLPFDPLWVEAGATLGGTVAAGISGPGRFRYGGVRDFILGIRFVDGLGRLLRMGGKVVKNSAGFDLPKFFVGSLGRFGVLAEITFKVFPSPPARLTLKLTAADAAAAVQILNQVAKARWETEALELLPDGKTIYLRLAGPSEALDAISREILTRWPGQTLPASKAEVAWNEVREVGWRHENGTLIKVAVTPSAIAQLFQSVQSLKDARVHISSGGNVAFISLPASVQAAELHKSLSSLGLSGVTLSGDAALWSGVHPQTAITASVKEALDPQKRFPTLED